MIGVRKKFSKKLYDKHDLPGKLAVIKFLKLYFNIDAEIRKEDYGSDVVAGNKRYEATHRPEWFGPNFSFPTVHVPERVEEKLRYKGCWYCTVNADSSYILICYGPTVLLYPPKESSNRFVASGERFFDVPIDEWKLYKLKDSPPPIDIDKEIEEFIKNKEKVQI